MIDRSGDILSQLSEALVGPSASQMSKSLAKRPTTPSPQPVTAQEPAAEPGGRRSARLRNRAAWMYYVEDMTQNAIGEALGIGRVTVVRMLADARALNEVKISLRRDLDELPRLERGLEAKFGLETAIVAPLSSPNADPTNVIGAATGHYVSELVRPHMKLGVGWGRTLLSALNFMDDAHVPDFNVVSLLGGISAVHQYNPAEFAWQFSRLFRADCYLIAAPAVVDSPETKTALIERCGLGVVFGMAETLDAVLLSVGGMFPTSTAHLFNYFSEEDRKSLIAAGAVGDCLYNFYDSAGAIVDHPLNARVMSAPIANLRKTPLRILTSGGPDKIAALKGAIPLLNPTVFITDEVTAAALLTDQA
jgi:DNA-binding transcriptional regulator LsrR (DeoR family)